MSKKSPKTKIEKKIVKRSEKIVKRDDRSLHIKSVTFPNRTEVGLSHDEFKKGLQVYGNISATGSFILKSSGYINFGKEVYSHNAFVELFVGTGILGLIPYCYFLYESFTLRVSKENIKFINWKRFSSVVFLVFCMFGLPYESLSLSILLGLIISL